MTLPRCWYTSGTNAELWGSRGTYTEVPFEDLPPIDRARHDGSFAWLEAQPECFGIQYGLDDADVSDDEITARLDAIVATARGAGFTPPASFVTLLSRRDLYGRIPTCTACYFELPHRLADGALLRFMNDQQCCYVWCLHLLPGGGHEVVIAAPSFLDDPPCQDSLEDVATLTPLGVCADDFEEFIHRFWLENVLWDAAQRPRPHTPEEAAYLAHARSRRV